MGHRSGSTLHSLRLSWRLRCLAVPICLTEEAGDGLNSQDAKARSQRREETQEAEEWGIGSGFDSSFFAASLASSLLGCSNLFDCGGRGRIEQPRSQGAKSKRRRIATGRGIGHRVWFRLFILCGFLGVFAAWLFQFV